MQFGTFVDRLDAAVRSIVPPVTLAREETPATATWIRLPFRVGVTRTAGGSVLAWIGIRGVVGRQWIEPCEEASIERLALGFAAVLSAPSDDTADDAVS